MAAKLSRRRFIGNCAKFGGLGCALLAWNERRSAFAGTEAQESQNKAPIDVKKLAYCGLSCGETCELFRATSKNDAALKKSVYDKWEMKKKYGFEFDPDKVYCYGCKPDNKPLPIGADKCLVRKCAVENGFDSCVQCKTLASCQFDFWKSWPALYKYTQKLQENYSTQPGAVLRDSKIKN